MSDAYSTQATPDTLSAKRKMAAALLGKSIDTSPVQAWSQGAARLVQGLMGGYLANQADDADRKAIELRMNAPGMDGASPAPQAAPAAAPQPAMPGDLQNAIIKAATERGVPPEYLTRLAAVESGGNVNARSPLSSASGPFQFIKSTAQQYGLTNPQDPYASADAAARLTIDNKAALVKALGREPTPGELYLAHQQGAGGAAKALANPNAPAVAVLGQRAVTNNGGSPLETAGQFANRWTQKFPGQQVAQAPVAPVETASRAPSPIPPQMQGYIRQLIQSRTKENLAKADALYQQYTKPVEPKFNKLDDGTLYDERTGKTKTVDPGYRPLVTPEERARFGIPADDKRPYQALGSKLVNPPAETRLNIDQRAETAFDTASAKHQAERFDKIVQAGFEAKTNRSDIGALRDIGSRLTTGKTAEVIAALGPYAEALGAKIDGLGDMQAYQAIVSKIAPRMRVAGSGATSDFEMKKYLEAIPGLGKTPEGNALIETTMEALQNHQEAAADIASRAMNKEIAPREADKLLRELPDPLTAWKKNKGVAKLGEKAPTIDDLVKKYAK